MEEGKIVEAIGVVEIEPTRHEDLELFLWAPIFTPRVYAVWPHLSSAPQSPEYRKR